MWARFLSPAISSRKQAYAPFQPAFAKRPPGVSTDGACENAPLVVWPEQFALEASPPDNGTAQLRGATQRGLRCELPTDVYGCARTKTSFPRGPVSARDQEPFWRRLSANEGPNRFSLYRHRMCCLSVNFVPPRHFGRARAGLERFIFSMPATDIRSKRSDAQISSRRWAFVR